MDQLDHLSPEDRASFFGRTLEEELVGWIGGPRHTEASARLEHIARTRMVRLQDLLEAYAEPHSTRVHTPSPLRQVMTMGATVDAMPPPERIFEEAECPVCTDDNDLGVMSCGHTVCRTCYDSIRRHRASCPCPCCRSPSDGFWNLKLVR